MKRARPKPPPETIARQQRASAPGHSAWVSANAGSGKTHVLVARVIRLLLDGAEPSTILCITYTRAAAANMAGRIFDTLSQWAVMADASLADALAEMTGAPPGRGDLDRARRLFARAVETPGGLKIQTIHGFCERVLQLFPFEGNVPGSFRVLDERQSGALQSQAIDALVEQCAGDPRLAAALAQVAGETDDERFRPLLAALFGEHRGFLRGMASDPNRPDEVTARLARAHGISPATTAAELLAAWCEPGWFDARFADIAERLAAGKSGDRENAAALRGAAAAIDQSGAFEAMASIFATKTGDPRSDRGFCSAALGAEQPRIKARLVAEQARWFAARDGLRAVALVARTAALHRVAAAAFSAYERAKADRGALDFADLVDRTLVLVRKLDAAWVLHRLDRGLLHVLIDEAQDTSPAQWNIVERLVAELTAGAGQHERRRTLFVVGDEKQSIFGFQGAAPAGFGQWRREFDRRHRDAGIGFENVLLTLSFRSTHEVLSAVDAVFARPEAQAGLVFEGETAPPPHQPLEPKRPGFVDLWPIERAEAEPEVADAIGAPIDAPDPVSAAMRLAERVARQVAHLISHRDPTGRPVGAGDVMILVRRRGTFFDAVLKALKRAGLQVAGADRLVLGRHIAAMDLVALGHAMLTEADDFSLACVLKSPLCGLTDDDLIAIAPGRSGTLWQALVARRDADPRFAAAVARLRTWRKAATATPFAFYAQVLEADGGRRAMLARLGADAAEAIDAFLSRALDHQRDGVPTLTAFLAAFAAAGGEIKRDLDQSACRVRVMTVHAAKGLEAPIVILPDTTSLPSAAQGPPLAAMPVADEPLPIPVWIPRREHATPPAVLAKRAAREAELEEQRRLLYVAMTRAETGLVVCGYQRNANATDPAKFAEAGSWYTLVEPALAGAPPAGMSAGFVPGFEGEPVRRWRRDDPSFAPEAGEPTRGVAQPHLPDWLFRAAPAEPPLPPPLKPSDAFSAADRLDRPPEPGQTRVSDTARQRGILAHRLLEALAPISADRREHVGSTIGLRHGGALTGAEREALLGDVLRALASPALAALFGPGSVAESPLAGRVRLASGEVREVAGRIDRMAVAPDCIVIADFKTAPPPAAGAVPAAALAQLALYRALVADIVPGRRIDCLLVHLSGPTILEIAPDRLDAAFRALTLA